jgi:glucosamine--fructose-6-phosphate aminotransferase (isomerizing)
MGRSRSSASVIVIAPRDDLFDKTISNMEKWRRGGKIVLLTDDKGQERTEKHFRRSHTTGASLFRRLYAPRSAARLWRGGLHGQDAIRNLAKSVTVE